jgi:hypothetical protein
MTSEPKSQITYKAFVLTVEGGGLVSVELLGWASSLVAATQWVDEGRYIWSPSLRH